MTQYNNQKKNKHKSLNRPFHPYS